jgi:CubicO group peptidase (beta-lactamase class C family)
VDTVLKLSSMNKMITGVAIAQLAEAGRLSFGDLVEHICSSIPERTWQAASPFITC